MKPHLSHSRLKAFSLTELLVVLVIMGILVLIALPNFLPKIAEAKAQEAKLQLQHLYTLEKSHFYMYSKYSMDFEGVGCEDVKVTVTGSISTATYFFQWMRQVGSIWVLEYLEAIPGTGGSIVSQPLGTSIQQGTYKVVVTNSEGCKVETPTKLIEPPVLRTMDLAFVMSAEPLILEEAIVEYPDNIVGDVAMDILSAMNDKVTACQEMKQAEVMSSFGGCIDEDEFIDNFNIEMEQDEHVFTLYYYDRAGNLVTTVPPEGIAPLNNTEIAQVANLRQSGAGSATATSHTLQSNYNYNSITQLVNQETPDGGISNMIYNDKGQLRFAQSAQQALDGTYSYFKFDATGREIETGEAALSVSFQQLDQPAFLTPTSYDPDYIFPDGDDDVLDYTRTVYTQSANVSCYGQNQRNIENRVSYKFTAHAESINQAPIPKSFNYFSYDIHGNVEWMIQKTAGFTSNYVEYEYDLLSGQVSLIKYNQYRKDRFFHKYEYDEDVRIIKGFTSKDGQIWDADIHYNYYKHGPLQRIEIGEDNLQGSDYVYTIEGWLKSINEHTLDKLQDPGNDGNGSGFSEDLFGMTLTYYGGDYKRGAAATDVLNSGHTAHLNAGSTNDLFNGNVSAWAWKNEPLTSSTNDAHCFAHQTYYHAMKNLTSFGSALLLAISLPLISNAQLLFPETMQVTINLDESTLKFNTFEDEEDLLFTNKFRNYYWYKTNELLTTQGGYEGRLLHGEFTELYDSKSLKRKGEFRKGTKQGSWRYWNTEGALTAMTKYRAGRRSGRSLRFDDQGYISESHRYKSDAKNGFSYIYTNGQVVKLIEFEDGVVLEEFNLPEPCSKHSARMYKHSWYRSIRAPRENNYEDDSIEDTSSKED